MDIPTSTAEDPNYNPVAHFATLAEYRRIAEEQDRESHARMKRYQELKRSEELERCTRATLTLKGYDKAIELEQHSRSREQSDYCRSK